MILFNFSKKDYIIVFVFIFFVSIFSIISKTIKYQRQKYRNDAFVSKPEIVSQILKQNSGDFYIGDINAPIEIIEYMDFKCYSCIVNFTKNFDTIYKDYIQNKLVKLIIRPYIVYTESMYASKFLLCNGVNMKNDSEKITLIKASFEALSIIDKNKNDNNNIFIKNLLNIYNKYNINTTEFHNCIN